MGANAIGITGPLRTVINNTESDIPIYTRVKISGAKIEGQIPIAVASAADSKLGIMITQQDIPAGNSGTALDVKKGGSQIIVSTGALTAGVAVDLADNGQYVTTDGSPVGVSEDTTTGAGYAVVTLYP